MPFMKLPITIFKRDLAAEVTWQNSAPDGTQTVLDEDEFAALDLDAETSQQARAALEELQKLFADNKNPDLS